MELQFLKKGNEYEAEFVAYSDFNLHIEGVEEDDVLLYQKSVEDGEYAYVRGATPPNAYGEVYDAACSVLVPPIWLKITTNNMPTRAEVIFA